MKNYTDFNSNDFQKLFENMADGAAIFQAVDKGGNFIFVNLNKAGEKISQVRQEDIIGRKVTETYPAVAEIGLLDVFCRVWRTGVSEYLPGILYKDKRTEHWAENYILRLSSGLIVMIYSNITNSRQEEEEIKNIAKFPAENPNPVLRIARDGTLLFVNHAGLIKLADWHLQIGQLVSSMLRDLVFKVFESSSKQQCDLEYGEHMYSFYIVPIIESGYVNLYGLDIAERKKIDVMLKESETSFKAIFDNANDMILLADKETKRFYIGNNKACQILGYSLEEIKNLGIPDIHPKENIPYVIEQVERQVRKEIAVIKDLPVKRKDGSVFYADVSTSLMELSGKIYLLGIFRDNTERRQAEEELRKVKQQMEFILGVTKTGLDIIDSSFNLVYVDPEWAKIYGDYRGKKCFDYFMDRKEICPDCGILEAFETKKVVIQDETLAKENNRPIQVTSIPFQNEKKEWLFAEINVDISERKKIEESSRLAQLGKLISDMAHEVNNPLMIISGNAQLSLMKGNKKEDINNNLKIIFEECQRAKNIIHRFLKFSRPNKGEVKKANINKSLDTVAAIMKHQSKSINVEIKKDYLKNPPLVTIDEQQIQEVFMNLINNAQEAMPKGGTITITTSLEGDFLRIDFKDTGTGMPEEILKRSPEQFFTTKEKGTGLGLSICYGIVNTHNGKLRIESEVNKGTTVTLLLPLSG